MTGTDDPTENAKIEQASQTLLQEVRDANQVLAKLKAHADRLGEATSEQVRKAVMEIRLRLNREEVFVCVVGEQKAGKSTLLNAILGMPLLGTAVRECTGTVTYLRCGDRLGYRARLGAEQWEDFADVFPDQLDDFATEIAEQQKGLERCDQIEAEYPVHQRKLEQTLHEMKQTLATQLQELRTADVAAAECEDRHSQQLEQTQALKKQLREAGQAVPWQYRHAGGWRATPHRMVRLITKRWRDSDWENHLAEVTRLEQQQVLVLKLAKEMQQANEIADTKRQLVAEQQDKVEATTLQLEEVCETLRVLPETRARYQQHKQQIEQASLEHQTARWERFHDDVKQLTDMNHRGHEVEELHLTVPTKRLPTGVVLIDTPGVNTATEANRERAWRAIEEHADACMVVSDLVQTVSESTRQFVQQVQTVTPHLLLVLTKLDAVLRNATLSGGDAEEEVAEAIQVGRSRFAAEVGRSEQEVLAFAVAARAALEDKEGPAVAAFNAELTKIFAVVAAEQSIAVSAKCASIVRKVHRDSADKIAETERAYSDRIETLVRQQVKNPQALCDSSVSALVPKVRQLGQDVSELLREDLEARLTNLRVQFRQQFESASDAPRFAKAVKQFQEEMPAQLQQIAQACRRQIDTQFASAIADLIEQARRPLRERYRISRSIVAKAPPPPAMTIEVVSPVASLSLTHQADELLVKLQRHINHNQQLAQSMGLLGANAARHYSSGNAGFALAAIAVQGVRAALHARKFPELKQSCIAEIEEMIAQLTTAVTSEAGAGPAAVEQQIGQQLTQIVTQDTVLFQRWIKPVIQQEKQLLEAERKRLGHLQVLRNKLDKHDGNLRAGLDAATAICLGLSRQRDESNTECPIDE